jgi:streptogramin lyase
VPATAGASVAGTPSPSTPIEGSRTLLPERTSGTSVAVAPDGTAWFGALTESGPVLAHARGAKLSLAKLSPRKARWARTAGLRFDAQGNLWFAEEGPFGSSIVRREPSGAQRKFPLSSRADVNALAVGTEGDVWYVRGWRESPVIGRVAADGTQTRTRLAQGSRPSSVAVGPEGAAWFTETGPSKVGRMAPGAAPQLFSLPRGTHPRQIVAGPDGALWFSEEGRHLGHGKVEDRIGRITTAGEVSEFMIPFGDSTDALAADPRGAIWFTTDTGYFASISTAGAIGPHGCLSGYCGTGINDIALAPDGTLWFSGDHESCEGCGGSASLMNENLGTPIGSFPTASLAPTG